MGESGTCHIGGVVEAAGSSVRTIRHFDVAGLVPPSGRNRGCRLYADETSIGSALVRHMKPLGITSEGMRDLLEVREIA